MARAKVTKESTPRMARKPPALLAGIGARRNSSGAELRASGLNTRLASPDSGCDARARHTGWVSNTFLGLRLTQRAGSPNNAPMNVIKRIIILSALVWVFPFPAYAEDSVVGIWSSTARTKGGLGSQWVFTKEGKVTHTFGALVDFKYEIKGNRIKTTFQDTDQAINEVTEDEFTLGGETLTLNPRTPDRKQVMKRAGKPHKGAHAIVGDWTYTHYTGGPALMRYSREGVVQLSVPFRTLAGTYRINQGALNIEFVDQKAITNKFRRDDNLLILMESVNAENKYTEFRY
jgi:hypothetical protein